MPNAKKVKVKVLYSCYYQGVKYEPGIYNLDADIAGGLLKTLHAVTYEEPKKAKPAKVKKEGDSNGS